MKATPFLSWSRPITPGDVPRWCPPVGSLVQFPFLSNTDTYLILDYVEADNISGPGTEGKELEHCYKAKVFNLNQQISVFLWLIPETDQATIKIVQLPET